MSSRSAPRIGFWLRFFVLVLGSATPSRSAQAQAQVSFSEEADELSSVLQLMHARLALMPSVATYKWRAQLPILDQAREDQLLAEIGQKAEALGLDGSSARALFAVQMQLARALQERTVASLSEHGWRGGKAPDLKTVLRPKLDRIGDQLLLTLARVQPALSVDDLVARHSERASRLLEPLGLTREQVGALLTALSQLRAGTQSALRRILARQELRVGTSGDYAPFSLERGKVLSGSDIARAQRFARSLQVSVRFVRTRWSTLMADYARGAFDIAVGGISVTPERSAVARFSLPYHHGGKTPIARCKDRKRFTTLAEIDQPSVRVIVNPGGTNEAFAKSQLSHASLRVFPDNRAIFAELVQGRADVMVTDDVEVALQTNAHPELCRTTSALFAPADKAWLVQPDEDLLRAVDAWLSAVEAGGQSRLGK
jgi:cyclohexadienyl dehydratase